MKYFNYYLPLNFQIISYKSVLVKFWGAFKDLFNEILILYTVYSNSVSIESLFKYSQSFTSYFDACFFSFNLSFTLYPFRRVGRVNLVLRHFTPHVLTANFLRKCHIERGNENNPYPKNPQPSGLEVWPHIQIFLPKSHLT